MATPVASPDSRRIASLLARLDPCPQASCQVPGCVHVHESSSSPQVGGAPALAA